MSTRAEAVEYEKLAQALAGRLASALGNATEICEHDVKLTGRGTTNQIDVHWIGQINGQRHRILIECKRHKKPLEQSYVHAFRSVVDDIAADGIATTGVFMHPVGYQRGAKRLAKTYDLVLLEVREPTDRDLDGRVLKINFEFIITTLTLQGVEFGWVGPLEGEWPTFLADTAMVHRTNGREPIGIQLLLARELGETADEQYAAAETTETCRIEFPEPTPIEIDGAIVGKPSPRLAGRTSVSCAPIPASDREEKASRTSRRTCSAAERRGSP